MWNGTEISQNFLYSTDSIVLIAVTPTMDRTTTDKKEEKVDPAVKLQNDAVNATSTISETHSLRLLDNVFHSLVLLTGRSCIWWDLVECLLFATIWLWTSATHWTCSVFKGSWQFMESACTSYRLRGFFAYPLLSLCVSYRLGAVLRPWQRTHAVKSVIVCHFRAQRPYEQQKYWPPQKRSPRLLQARGHFSWCW